MDLKLKEETVKIVDKQNKIQLNCDRIAK